LILVLSVVWRVGSSSSLGRWLNDVNLSIWLLENLTSVQLNYLLGLLGILLGDRRKELRWRNCGLTKSLQRRWALVAGVAHNNIADVTFTRFFIYNLSHIFPRCGHIFPQKLFKRSKENLLWILKRDISIFILLGGIDSNGTDNKLLFGVDLNKLLFSRDLVSNGGHRSVDSSSR